MPTIIKINGTVLVLPKTANPGTIYAALSAAVTVEEDFEVRRERNGRRDFRNFYKPAEPAQIELVKVEDDQFILAEKPVAKGREAGAPKPVLRLTGGAS